MNQELETVTLATLGGGAAAEKFDAELERAIANMLDPNTSDKATRKVTLTVAMKPVDDRRKAAGVTLQIKSTLAGPRDGETTFFIGERDGRAVAVEHNPDQMKLFDEPRDKPRAVVVDKQTGEIKE